MSTPPHLDQRECTLPDLFAIIPFQGSVNPYHGQAASESSQWVESYGAFTGNQKLHFSMSCFELLASEAYPYTDLPKLRMCCDLINLLSVVDELCDDKSGDGAKKLSNQYLRGLNGNPCDGSLISRMAKDFRGRLEQHIHSDSGVMKRYLEQSRNTVTAIAHEAKMREHSDQIDTETFIEFRRKNSAILVCYPFIELALGIELPEQVFGEKEFIQMQDAAADIISWTNDICSYCRESSKGIAGINLITVLIRSKNMTIQGAMDYSGILIKQRIHDFLCGKAGLRSFGPVDPDVRAYIMGLEQWIIGSTNWCFDSGRFFGPKHTQVKEKSVVNFDEVMSAAGMTY